MTEETIGLEKFKLVLLKYMDEVLPELVAGERRIDFSMMSKINADEILFRLVQEVWGETLEYIAVEYPATWWEHVKQRFAPNWFKKLWPVKCNAARIEARALYPKMSFPDEPHNLKGFVREYGNDGASLSCKFDLGDEIRKLGDRLIEHRKVESD